MDNFKTLPWEGERSTEIRLFLDLCDSRTIVILTQMHLAVTILIKKSIPKTAKLIIRTRSKVIEPLGTMFRQSELFPTRDQFYSYPHELTSLNNFSIFWCQEI
jgi:hypothetical protein